MVSRKRLASLGWKFAGDFEGFGLEVEGLNWENWKNSICVLDRSG
jgi:hypothetical protein